MKARPLVALALALTFAVSGSAAAHASSAVPDPAAPRAGDAWTAIASGSPTVLHGRPDGSTYKTSTMMSVLLLDPIDSYQCNTVNNASHVVKTYSPVRKLAGNTSSTIDLKCGTANSGYLHITSHAEEWQDRVTWAGGGSAWDDFMDYVVNESLLRPIRVVAQAGNVSCFTVPITMQKSSGETLVFNPTTAVSNNNKLIITSFPSTVTNCK